MCGRFAFFSSIPVCSSTFSGDLFFTLLDYFSLEWTWKDNSIWLDCDAWTSMDIKSFLERTNIFLTWASEALHNETLWDQDFSKYVQTGSKEMLFPALDCKYSRRKIKYRCLCKKLSGNSWEIAEAFSKKSFKSFHLVPSIHPSSIEISENARAFESRGLWVFNKHQVLINFKTFLGSNMFTRHYCIVVLQTLTPSNLKALTIRKVILRILEISSDQKNMMR